MPTLFPQRQKGPGGTSSSYIPALDGLRAIAFLCVFGAHATAHTISRFVPATFGVTIFFFLSGYLITTLLRGELEKTGTVSLRDFYIRRALRIFVPMYVAYLVAFVLAKLFQQPAGTGEGLLAALLYCFNYVRMLAPEATVPAGMDVIWSLSVEEHFYILFPLLFLALARYRASARTKVGLLLALCVAGLCWRTFVELHNFPASWTYYATDCRFDSILWGSLLALWNNPRFERPLPVLKRYSGLFAGTAFVATIATMFSGSLLYRDTLRYSLQGIFLYFIFFFAISSSTHWSVRWLENPALRYLGWVSYSMYLIHVVLLHILGAHLPEKDWIVAPVCFAVTLLYAVVIRHTVELPLQAVRSRFRHAPPPISASLPIEGI